MDGYVESEDQARAERRPGLFIPWNVLVMVGIVVVAVAVTVLSAVLPQVGVPIGVGVAVAALLFGVWTQYPGRDGGPR